MIRWLIGSAILLLATSALTWAVVLRPTPGAGGPVEAVRSLAIDPNAIESIELRSPGTDAPGRVRVARSGLTGGLPVWVVRQRAAPSAGSEQGWVDWPADRTRVRAAIRVLQTLQLEPVAEGGRLATNAPIASLVIAERGAETTIDFLERPLMGRARVRVTPSDGSAFDATVGSDVFDAMVQTGPSAWGSVFLLQPVASGPSRVRLIVDDTRVELLRRADRWRLSHPYAVPARAETVTELLGQLGRVRVEGESGGAAETPTGFPEAPTATVTVRADRPATGDTYTQRLEIGDLSSLGGDTVRVRVTATLGSRTVWGPRVLEVPSDALDAIDPNADAYVSPTPSGLNADAIGGFRLVPAGLGLDATPTTEGRGVREFRRYGTEWVYMYDDARAPAPENDAEAMAGLVRAVTAGVAREIQRVERAGISSTERSRLVMLDPLYQPAEVYEIDLDPGGDGFGVGVGGLRWSLGATAEADLAHLGWLARTLDEATGVGAGPVP